MSNVVALQQGKQVNASIIERVIAMGDLSKLTSEERVAYYSAVCNSVGLNPLTRPFDFINLNGKLTLYTRRDATDQLRKLNAVSMTIVGRERIDDCYVVTARATTPDGRTDESVGAVPIGSLKGESLANALMKAETKAKRRVTLSICGLGWLDESELSTTNAQRVRVDESGTILDATPAPPRGALPKANAPAPIDTLDAATRAVQLGEFMADASTLQELEALKPEWAKLKGQIPPAAWNNLVDIYNDRAAVLS